ncbi:MAG: beta-class carbonic anhydrase [Promethearchaeota archaeon]
MTVLERLLEGNERFQEIYMKYANRLPSKPRKKLAILTCTDTRLNPIRIFHINIGDAEILRNAGNQVTNDVIRSLVNAVANGVNEIVILGHTNCSLTEISQNKLTLIQELGSFFNLPFQDKSDEIFVNFSDEERNVRDQVSKLRSSSTIPPNIPIHGLIFNVENGTLKVIVNGYKQLIESKPSPTSLKLNMLSIKMPTIYLGSFFTFFKKLKKSSLKSSNRSD